MLMSILRDVKKLVDMDSNPLLVGNFPAVPSNDCFMQASSESAYTKSARHGQFQEKGEKFRLLHRMFSFRIFFRREIITK